MDNLKSETLYTFVTMDDDYACSNWFFTPSLEQAKKFMTILHPKFNASFLLKRRSQKIKNLIYELDDAFNKRLRKKYTDIQKKALKEHKKNGESELYLSLIEENNIHTNTQCEIRKQYRKSTNKRRLLASNLYGLYNKYDVFGEEVSLEYCISEIEEVKTNKIFV